MGAPYTVPGMQSSCISSRIGRLDEVAIGLAATASGPPVNEQLRSMIEDKVARDPRRADTPIARHRLSIDRKAVALLCFPPKSKEVVWDGRGRAGPARAVERHRGAQGLRGSARSAHRLLTRSCLSERSAPKARAASCTTAPEVRDVMDASQLDNSAR